jgi:hypothetical protein
MDSVYSANDRAESKALFDLAEWLTIEQLIKYGGEYL